MGKGGSEESAEESERAQTRNDERTQMNLLPTHSGQQEVCARTWKLCVMLIPITSGGLRLPVSTSRVSARERVMLTRPAETGGA